MVKIEAGSFVVSVEFGDVVSFDGFVWRCVRCRWVRKWVCYGMAMRMRRVIECVKESIGVEVKSGYGHGGSESAWCCVLLLFVRLHSLFLLRLISPSHSVDICGFSGVFFLP